MELTDQNFDQEVLKSQSPVLVDFFAEWCGPCKVQAPIVEELEKEYQGKAKVFQIDVDSNPQTAGQYQIMSIPTLAIFNNGQMTEKLTGLQKKTVLKEKLDKLF